MLQKIYWAFYFSLWIFVKKFWVILSWFQFKEEVTYKRQSRLILLNNCNSGKLNSKTQKSNFFVFFLHCKFSVCCLFKIWSQLISYILHLSVISILCKIIKCNIINKLLFIRWSKFDLFFSNKRNLQLWLFLLNRIIS